MAYLPLFRNGKRRVAEEEELPLDALSSSLSAPPGRGKIFFTSMVVAIRF